MTAPPDVATGGLTELAVRARVDGAVTEIPLDRIVVDDVLELGHGQMITFCLGS